MKQSKKNSVSACRWSLKWLALVITLANIGSVLAVDDETKAHEIKYENIDKKCLSNKMAIPFYYYIMLKFENDFNKLEGAVIADFEVTEPPQSSCNGKKLQASGTEIVLHLDKRYEIIGVELLIENSAGDLIREDLIDDPYLMENSNLEEEEFELIRDSGKKLVVIRSHDPLPVGSFGRVKVKYQDLSFGSSDFITRKKDGSFKRFTLNPGRARELLACFEQQNPRTRVQLALTYPGDEGWFRARDYHHQFSSYSRYHDGTFEGSNYFTMSDLSIDELAFTLTKRPISR